MEEFQTIHDWERDGSISTTVVEAIAALDGRDPTTLEPLYSVVDTDALDGLFAPRAGQPRGELDGHVSFSLDGYQVEVQANGEVTVCRSSTEGDRALDEVPATDEPREVIFDTMSFQDELAGLIWTAESNGVDVEGGWACRDGTDHPERGVEIYAVERREELG